METTAAAKLRCAMALLAACCLPGQTARAQEAPTQAVPPTVSTQVSAPVPTQAPSPWMLLPTFSSNPKLGISAGGMVAYIKKIDPQSQVSIVGLNAQYTSTDSATVSLFARTSFSADQHRLSVGGIGGVIKNDYDDFLGSGQPLKSEDHIRAIFARYLYRLPEDWFIGAQALSTNYEIVGQSALDGEMLALLGLTGFKSAGAGLVVQHDSRDLQDAPKTGWMLNFNNVAYRQTADFNVYRLDYRQFWSHGDGHVFAVRQSNQWTQDAPAAANAPVMLRGYTAGEYLGKFMSSIEGEERHRFAERWTATLFAGVACLYGGNRSSCSDSDDLFPSVGAGVQYVLKPVQGIVANLEFAVGKAGNNAVLFKMGYSW